jgi:hypothetical protein
VHDVLVARTDRGAEDMQFVVEAGGCGAGDLSV